MALDVSKLRQQEQVQATGNNPAAGTSASSSSQPIDMKTGTMTPEEKQAKVLEFIKSGEFKKCPDDQKLELLKQQFPDLAGLPEKDLARYFAEAINTLPAEEQAEVTQTLAKTIDENTLNTELKTASESATVEQTTEAPPEEAATNDTNSQDLETLALQYAEKNKLGASIDEIISHIKSKQVENTQLTEEEQQILNLYNANNNTEVAKTSENTEVPQLEHEPTLDEKLQAKEKELEAAISEYAKQTNQNDVDPDILISDILKKFTYGEKLTELEEQIRELQITTSEMRAGKPKEQAETSTDNDTDIFRNIKRSDDEKKSIQNEKQEELIREFLEKNDPDFGNLKNRKQNQRIEELQDSLSKLAMDTLGTKKNEKRPRVTEQMRRLLQYANKHNISIDELIEMSPERLNEVLKEQDNEILLNILGSFNKQDNTEVDYSYRLTSICQNYLIETGELTGLSDEEKDKKIEEFTTHVIYQTTGIRINAKTSEKQFDDLSIRATLILEHYADAKPEELNKDLTNGKFKINNRTKNDIILLQAENRLEDPNLSSADRELIQQQYQIATDMNALYKEYPDARFDTGRDIYNAILRYEAEGHTLNETLEKEKLRLSKRLDSPVGIDNAYNGISKGVEQIFNHQISADQSSQEIIEEMFQKVDLDDYRKLSPEELEIQLKNDYQEANGTADEKIRRCQQDVARRVALALGYDDEWFNSKIIQSAEVQVDNLTRANNETLPETIQACTNPEIRTWILQSYQKWDDINVDTGAEITGNTLATGSDADKYTVAKGNATHYSVEENTTIAKALTERDDINQKSISEYGQRLTTYTENDEDKIELGKGLASLGNAALTEGVAAGGQSITDQNLRNQYNSAITEAAQNYPPEVQQTIQTVLTTGQISEQTRNSSAPASNSYYPEADTYTPTTSSNSSNTYHQTNSTTTTTTTSSTTTTTTQETYNNVYQASTSSTVDYTTPVVGRTYTSSNLDITQSIIENGLRHTTTSEPISKTTSTPSVDTSKIKEQAQQAQVAASQQMKDLALENVAEVKAKIDESIAEWELKQELKLTDEVISELKEIAASETLEEYMEANPTKREEVLTKLSNADSISEVYDILLSALGSKVHQKFIDNLARGGSTGNIRAFLNSKAGNTDVIKQILLRTTSTTLKNELIGMLPASDVLELLDKNLITTLENVDHEIIFTYVSKNIYSMTQTNFANFLKYLPFDEREKLIEMRNKAMGIKPEVETTKVDVEEQSVQTNPIAQDQIQTGTTQGFGFAQNPVQQSQQLQPQQAQQQQTQNKTSQKADTEPVDNPQTKFKAGETTKVLNDGRVITSQGTTFAGISNNVEEGFRVVDPKPKKDKTGAPIGMNDEVLVPGSQEWLMKYNKQAPKVAFTMAALEEQAEDDGLNFGSNRVKIGQPIKKKYNPNGFNIRG